MGSLFDAQFAFSQDDCNVNCRPADYAIAKSQIPAIQTAATSAPSGVTCIVPVKFYILLDDDGNYFQWNLPIDEPYIETALANLEQKFSTVNHPFDFVRCGDISYIHNTAFMNNQMNVNEYAYTPNVVNVYVRGKNGSSSAYWPWSDGLIINLGGYSKLLSSTFPHEFGHHFGLFHTFGSGAIYQVPTHIDPIQSDPANQIDHPYANAQGTYPRELVYQVGVNTLPLGAIFINENCEYAGDFCCDTPAACDESIFYPGCSYSNCNYDGSYVDYNNMAIDDPTNIIASNLMSYTVNQCRIEFTPDQLERALGYYKDIRFHQYLSPNCGNLNDQVEYEGTDKGLNLVSVKLLQGSNVNRSVTDPDGNFDGLLLSNSFTNTITPDVKKLGSNSDFTFTDGDWIDGVTTYDIVQITKYILGQLTFDGYDLVAADVNNSGTVTTFDLVLIRKLILKINLTFPAFSQPWRYIPEYIPIDNPQDFDGVGVDNPFQYNLTGLPFFPMQAFSDKAGFDGVKLGDVNGNNTENIGNNPPTEGDPIYVDIEKTIAAGKAHFGFKVEDFDDILGYQMEIQFDPLKLSFDQSIEEDLVGVPADFFGTTNTAQGMIYTLWYDDQNAQAVTMEDFKKIFTLVFDEIGGNTDGELTLLENIGFRASNESVEPKNFAIGENGEIRPIVLRQLGKGDLASIQSVPNPFNNTLSLLIKAVNSGNTNIRIFNSMGQQLSFLKLYLYKGGNNIPIEGIENWPDGIYFLTVEIDGEVYTDKIIKKN